MNYIAMKFWVDGFVLLLVGCNLAYTWWSNREKVNSKRFKILEDAVAKRATRTELENAQTRFEVRIEKNEKQLKEHEGWLTRLNERVEHIPGHKDHNKMAARVDDMHAELHGATEAINGLRRAVDLMYEHLLNNGGKG